MLTGEQMVSTACNSLLLIRSTLQAFWQLTKVRGSVLSKLDRDKKWRIRFC